MHQQCSQSGFHTQVGAFRHNLDGQVDDDIALPSQRMRRDAMRADHGSLVLMKDFCCEHSEQPASKRGHQAAEIRVVARC